MQHYGHELQLRVADQQRRAVRVDGQCRYLSGRNAAVHSARHVQTEVQRDRALQLLLHFESLRGASASGCSADLHGRRHLQAEV